MRVQGLTESNECMQLPFVQARVCPEVVSLKEMVNSPMRCRRYVRFTRNETDLPLSGFMIIVLSSHNLTADALSFLVIVATCWNEIRMLRR